VKYELISRDTYSAQVQPVDEPMYGIDRAMPLDLLEARNAVRIARDAHADQYAPDTFEKAKDLLDRANEYYRRKKGSGPIGTAARQAVQAAEAARVITIKKEEDEEVAAERRAQQEREDQARAEAARHQAEAEEAQAAAAQAQTHAAQAQAQAEAEAQQRQQAELAQQQATQQAQQATEQAQQAEQARQQAEQARQQAEQARQQAENDKAQMRARMLQQLNQVLETKDSARGLIVSMPDVLFDTAKADLKSGARERLAKVAGILIAYPDIHVEIDGYTDSTGSLEFNERLSQERATAVQTYLTSQGVNSGMITTQGFGPSDPIASNDTSAGRQQNRRVELVVSGASIGQAVNAPSQ
jgi:outer membrane protein OmpA-like peptidoglycan-associated protein